MVFGGPSARGFPLASREVGIPKKTGWTPLPDFLRYSRRTSLTAPHIQNCPTGFWLGGYRPALSDWVGSECRPVASVALGATRFWRPSFFALLLIKIEARCVRTSNTPPMACVCYKESKTGLRSKIDQVELP